jgi:hypothetical protein
MCKSDKKLSDTKIKLCAINKLFNFQGLKNEVLIVIYIIRQWRNVELSFFSLTWENWLFQIYPIYYHDLWIPYLWMNLFIQIYL